MLIKKGLDPGASYRDSQRQNKGGKPQILTWKKEMFISQYTSGEAVKEMGTQLS